MRNARIVAFTFLLLSMIATMFPPFIWGEELLKDQGVRVRVSLRGVDLPVKSYAFLFGDSKQKFDSGLWGWDETKQEPRKTLITLQRNLLLPELMLEYVLALIVALLGAFCASQQGAIASIRERLKRGIRRFTTYPKGPNKREEPSPESRTIQLVTNKEEALESLMRGPATMPEALAKKLFDEHLIFESPEGYRLTTLGRKFIRDGSQA